jgi:uncharacterized membrane protein
MTSTDTILVIAIMTLAAALCRLGGFWFMGFVRITPRFEAGLKMLPIGVMLGLMVPAVMKGGLPEMAAIGIVMCLTKLGLNEFISTSAGLVTVAAVRMLLGQV